MGKRRRKVVILALLFLLAVGRRENLRAAERTGSICMNCKIQQNDREVCLSGDTYAIAFIAGARMLENHGIVYSPCPDFENMDYDWGNMTASQLNAAAKQLKVYADSQGKYDRSQETGPDGKVRFDNLEPGIYLISRIQAEEKNKEYVTDPVLIGIPSDENGVLVYQVEAEPKFEWKNQEEEVPDKPIEKEESGPGKEANAKTGDETAGRLWLGLCGAGIICAAFIIKKKKEEPGNP